MLLHNICQIIVSFDNNHLSTCKLNNITWYDELFICHSIFINPQNVSIVAHPSPISLMADIACIFKSSCWHDIKPTKFFSQQLDVHTHHPTPHTPPYHPPTHTQTQITNRTHAQNDQTAHTHKITTPHTHKMTTPHTHTK